MSLNQNQSKYRILSKIWHSILDAANYYWSLLHLKFFSSLLKIVGLLFSFCTIIWTINSDVFFNVDENGINPFLLPYNHFSKSGSDTIKLSNIFSNVLEYQKKELHLILLDYTYERKTDVGKNKDSTLNNLVSKMRPVYNNGENIKENVPALITYSLIKEVLSYCNEEVFLFVYAGNVENNNCKHYEFSFSQNHPINSTFGDFKRQIDDKVNRNDIYTDLGYMVKRGVDEFRKKIEDKSNKVSITIISDFKNNDEKSSYKMNEQLKELKSSHEVISINIVDFIDNFNIREKTNFLSHKKAIIPFCSYYDSDFILNRNINYDDIIRIIGSPTSILNNNVKLTVPNNLYYPLNQSQVILLKNNMSHEYILNFPKIYIDNLEYSNGEKLSAEKKFTENNIHSLLLKEKFISIRFTPSGSISSFPFFDIIDLKSDQRKKIRVITKINRKLDQSTSSILLYLYCLIYCLMCFVFLFSLLVVFKLSFDNKKWKTKKEWKTWAKCFFTNTTYVIIAFLSSILLCSFMFFAFQTIFKIYNSLWIFLQLSFFMLIFVGLISVLSNLKHQKGSLSCKPDFHYDEFLKCYIKNQ